MRAGPVPKIGQEAEVGERSKRRVGRKGYREAEGAEVVEVLWWMAGIIPRR